MIYENDIPDNLKFPNGVAVDTETMGLHIHRDRLCLIQLSDGKNEPIIVKIDPKHIDKAHNLKFLFASEYILKIFHYARFDMAILQNTYKIRVKNIYCTKIASKLIRTYTDKHGLKILCKEFLSKDISKAEQSSDWGNIVLTPEQIAYAKSDVLYLHELKEKLDIMLKREGKLDLAHNCFRALEDVIVNLDLCGYDFCSIFSH